LIQRDIINTKAPHEIKDIADVFLMRFGSEEGFEQPLAIVDLMDMAKFCERRNTLAHNWYLVRAIVDLLLADGMGGASVDDALVVLDGNELSFVVKNGPIALDEAIHLIPDSAIKVR